MKPSEALNRMAAAAGLLNSEEYKVLERALTKAPATRQKPERHWPVPAGSKARPCNGRDCHKVLYFITNPATNRKVPIDCTHCQEECWPPTQVEDGQGISHYRSCPNANDYSKTRPG